MQQVAGVPYPPAQPIFSVPGPPTCLKECFFKKGHPPSPIPSQQRHEACGPGFRDGSQGIRQHFIKTPV